MLAFPVPHPFIGTHREFTVSGRFTTHPECLFLQRRWRIRNTGGLPRFPPFKPLSSAGKPLWSVLLDLYHPFVWYKWSTFVTQCGKSIKIRNKPMPPGRLTIPLGFFFFLFIRARTTNHLSLLHQRVFGQRSGRKDDVVRNGPQRPRRQKAESRLKRKWTRNYPESNPNLQKSV